MRLYALVAVIAHMCTAQYDQLNEISDLPYMKADCVYVKEEVCGDCEIKFQKDCTIKMQEQHTPTTVEECQEYLCDGKNYTEKCSTQYETQCGTRMQYKEVEEDSPVCGTVEEEQCTEEGECKVNKVVKCKVEKKTVRKGVPETSCERVPIKMCRKEKCEEKVCKEKVVMQKEILPKESCELKEKLVCQEVGPLTCRLVTKKYCGDQFSEDPEVNKTIMELRGGRNLEDTAVHASSNQLVPRFLVLLVFSCVLL